MLSSCWTNSLGQWNWFSDVTGGTWISYIQWRKRTNFTAPGCKCTHVRKNDRRSGSGGPSVGLLEPNWWEVNPRNTSVLGSECVFVNVDRQDEGKSAPCTLIQCGPSSQFVFELVSRDCQPHSHFSCLSLSTPLYITLLLSPQKWLLWDVVLLGNEEKIVVSDGKTSEYNRISGARITCFWRIFTLIFYWRKLRHSKSDVLTRFTYMWGSCWRGLACWFSSFFFLLFIVTAYSFGLFWIRPIAPIIIDHDDNYRARLIIPKFSEYTQQKSQRCPRVRLESLFAIVCKNEAIEIKSTLVDKKINKKRFWQFCAHNCDTSQVFFQPTSRNFLSRAFTMPGDVRVWLEMGLQNGLQIVLCDPNPRHRSLCLLLLLCFFFLTGRWVIQRRQLINIIEEDKILI